jgi:hypothetical protein
MWTYPHSEGGVLVEVVVQNTGSLATGNNFFTDLYVDHIPTGPGDYTGSLRFWLDSPIAAGAVVTLTTVLQGADSLAALRATEIAPGDEITGTLYAQTDSTGAVGEPNQANNIYALGAPFCLAVQDAYEENDSFSSATPIALDEVQRHNIGKLQDSDWLSFQASEGVTYTLYTLDLDPAADTVVSLYATDGVTLLDTNDDALGTLASRIDWAAPATGEYYIRVQHWNPNVSGCGTGYSVSVITTPMAPNVVITASGEDVQLMWPHLAANASYEVWRDVVPYFDPDYPNAETILLDVITPDTRNSNVTYVDTSGLPNMSYFYLIRGKNGGITSDNSNRVGKFVRSIGPGMNLVSLPLTPDITAVQGVIGDQLTGASSELYADRIWVWDTDTQDYDYAWLIDGVGPPYDGQWWDGDPWGPSGITLEPGMGFWVQNRQTFSQTLVFVGSVLEAAEHSVEIGEGMQLIGSAYPVEQTLYEATFAEDGAHGASSELYADRIWYWDESLQDYDYAWLIDGVGPPYDGQWWDGDPWGETTITLTPGVGYWYQRRGSGPFLWTNPGNAP